MLNEKEWLRKKIRLMELENPTWVKHFEKHTPYINEQGFIVYGR